MRWLILAGLLVPGLARHLAAHEGHLEPMGTSVPVQQPAEGRIPMTELQMVLSHIKYPDYIHVLINPFPLFGMAIGVGLLLVSLYTRSSGAREASLALIVIAGIVTLVTIKSGQGGYDRVYDTLPMESQQWLDVHMARAERLQYLFYGTSLVALISIISTRRRMDARRVLAFLTLLGGIACVAVAGWISHAGGQVRHMEFREGPPPAGALPEGMRRHKHLPNEPAGERR